MAVYSTMFMGMTPFGWLFAGAIAEKAGAPLTVAIETTGCLAATAIFVRNLSGIRRKTRILLASGQIVGDVP